MHRSDELKLLKLDSKAVEPMNWKLEEILNELILLVSANEGLNELDQSTGGDEIIEINGKQFSKKVQKHHFVQF